MNPIETASFAELDQYQKAIKCRYDKLRKPVIEITDFLDQNGWKWQWRISQSQTVYLCVHYEKKYVEFTGASGPTVDVRVAKNCAAEKALEYFFPQKLEKRNRDKFEQAMEKCLDCELQSFKKAKSAFWNAKKSGNNSDTAEQIARDVQQQYLKNHLSTFLRMESLCDS